MFTLSLLLLHLGFFTLWAVFVFKFLPSGSPP